MTHYFFVKTKFIVTEKGEIFLVNKISNITGGRKLKVRKKQKANFFFITIIIFFVL